MTTTDAAVETALGVLRSDGPLTPWEILRSTGIGDNELRGELLIGWPNMNIWFAAGLSQVAYDVLVAIADRSELASCPTDGFGFILWLTAGDCLVAGMPLVGSRPPRKGYKTPRFAPVTIAALVP